MSTDDTAMLAPGYELEAVAARTEHSLVFVAQERRSGRRVAVKLAHDADGADALRREIQVLRGLRHPHIVAVVDAVATGDPWMVLPLAAASLEDVVSSHGAMEAEEVAGVIVAIASALQSVHRHRLVHGDVKPANILLNSDGRPLLADFGAAHAEGMPPTHFTATYFVDDGIEGDVAALARGGLFALADRERQPAGALRAVLHEFARLGDRPEVLIAAVTTVIADPRWPVIGPRTAAARAGPPTHPFGPRPPRPRDAVAPRRRTRPGRFALLVGAGVIAIGAMQVWREHASPPHPTITTVANR